MAPRGYVRLNKKRLKREGERERERERETERKERERESGEGKTRWMKKGWMKKETARAVC